MTACASPRRPWHRSYVTWCTLWSHVSSMVHPAPEGVVHPGLIDGAPWSHRWCTLVSSMVHPGLIDGAPWSHRSYLSYAMDRSMVCLMRHGFINGISFVMVLWLVPLARHVAPWILRCSSATNTEARSPFLHLLCPHQQCIDWAPFTCIPPAGGREPILCACSQLKAFTPNDMHECAAKCGTL